MAKEGSNLIVELSFDFGVKIMNFSDELYDARRFAIANQILRSGTAVGALVREAQSAESRDDFIHKMKVADKEAEEIEYWLLLCKHANSYPTRDDLIEDILSIKKVLNKIIAASRRNKNN